MTGGHPVSLDDDTLVIVREYDAPRERVFRAWTDPALLARWFCPEGCDMPFHRFEPRVGGSYRVCLRGKESGNEWWMQGEFREISPHDRIVLTHVWDDVDRRPDVDSVITVGFEDLGGRTRMHFHQVRFVSVAERDSHRGGWNSCFNRLEGMLARTEETP